MHTGCRWSLIVYAMIRASPCNLFVVCVYVPHAGRQNPTSSDTLDDMDNLLCSVPRHDCVIVMGDFNAKLPRNNGRLTGRWCIHSRANQAGYMLSRLMERRQLCAVSTLHQPRRHTNNATYLVKDSRYGPSQIDYILASCRWASSAHKSRVKWGVSCQRWGRHYDHGLVSCDWQCRVKSQGQQVKHIDYLPLEKNDAAMETFDASVARHMNDLPCDMDNASASLNRLTKCVTAAARETLPVKRPKPLRKHEVSQRTKMLFEERRRHFDTLSEQERRESTRAIAVSSRDDFRHYVHKVLDDIEEAESVGNMRSVTKLTCILAHKDRRTSCNPSKGADGRPITTTAQLLSEWAKFLGAKFQRPPADADRNLENLVAGKDVLGYDELGVCLKATGFDIVPIEAY